MNIKVRDIMVKQVVTSHPYKTVGHIKGIMKRNKIHSVPLINSDNEIEGIITSNDLVRDLSDDTLVRLVMTKKVYTIPKYADIHKAARLMLNYKIHHLVVTHEQKIVGLLSSFDLLKLMDDYRFVAKNPPTPSKKQRVLEV